MSKLTEIDRYIFAAKFLKYVGRHEASVELLSEAVSKYPDDARLRRYRGHGRITTRAYVTAAEDFEHAVQLISGTDDEHEFYQKETEPDVVNLLLGREEEVRDPHIPVNAETIAATAGLYKSTLHGSIWYHLGIAKYLLAEFEDALAAFQKADEVAVDDDLSVAILDWCYMALRRMERHEEAAQLLDRFETNSFSVTTTEDFYHRRLKMYKGESSPEALLEQDSGSYLALATQGYGVGNWHLYNGEEAKAREVFEMVVEHGTPAAFAYMAAEADLARMNA